MTPWVVRSSIITPRYDFGAVERRQRLPAGLARRVDARNDPLRRRFFIAGRAVDLSGQEQTAEPARLQRRIEPARVDVIIFDRIAGSQNARMLEARNRRHERALRLLGQRGRNPVRIDGRIVDALRLEKNLMAVAIGEADHLVLDRRTIARAAPGDRARIDGGAMRVGLDDAVGLGGGAGDVARKLRRRDRGRHRGEEFRLGIAKLDLEALPVDGCAVEPGRGPGLEPPERESGAVQALGERDRGRIAEASGRRALVAEMDHSAQEGAGGEHDCAARRSSGRQRARCP